MKFTHRFSPSVFLAGLLLVLSSLFGLGTLSGCADSSGLGSGSGACPAGFSCTPCPAGETTCTAPCPTGFACTPCPAGETTCTAPCPTGDICTTCPAGETTCAAPCPAGDVCTPINPKCVGAGSCPTVINCPAGTAFQPFVNASATDTTFAATVPASGGACVGCSVSNPTNVVNPATTNPAVITIPLGLVSGDQSLTVQDTVNSFPAGDLVGFVVSVPGASVLNLALLQPVTITAESIAADGTVTDEGSAGATRPVALDLLSLLANDGETVATVTATGTFNAVNIDVSGVANALTDINVFYAGACVATP
jgi:hypothetical protein